MNTPYRQRHPNGMQKAPSRLRHTPRGFTLTEVALAIGIAAGVLSVVVMLMSTLGNEVRRLKPYEAWKRPAFVNSGKSNSDSTTPATPDSSASSTNDNNSSTGTQTGSTPNVPLPDENLDPSKRPPANQPPPDPDDPTANSTANGSSPTGTSTP